MRQAVVTASVTLALGAAGAILMHAAGAPAPFLTGPAIAVTVAGLAGVKTGVPDLLRNACFIVLGLSMGQGVTPQVLEQAAAWPLSFACLAVMIVAIMAACAFLLRRVWAYDRRTAILSSTPGHLSYVLGLSADSNADVRIVALVQGIRVLALPLATPPIVLLAGEVSAHVGAPPPLLSAWEIAALTALSGGVGWLFIRLRIPAAFLMAGMVVSTLTHVTGLTAGVVPQQIAIPAFVAMGSLIGTRFSGVTTAELCKAAGAGAAITFVGAAFAVLGAVAVAWLTGLPLQVLLIAFAPGGVETMAAMAVTLNADPTFVAAHHVARLFLLSFLAPLALGRKR